MQAAGLAQAIDDIGGHFGCLCQGDRNGADPFNVTFRLGVTRFAGVDQAIDHVDLGLFHRGGFLLHGLFQLKGF